MYVEKIHIENFKGIDCCDLSFKKGFNLIIGENGKGKTSILEALSVGISAFIDGLPQKNLKPRTFVADDIRTVYEPQGDGAFQAKHYWPKIDITAFIDKKEYTWARSQEGIHGVTRNSTNIVGRKAENLLEEGKAILPVISYQSAARIWAQKREDSYELMTRWRTDRQEGYRECVNDTFSRDFLMNWCARMEQIAWQNNKPVREYEAVKQAVSTAMTILEDDEVHVFYDKRSEELLYDKEDKVLPIRSLSAGYQSLIWMIFDIAYRMAVLNPFLLEHVCETPGVVFIDELDVHLHPRWQWKVISVLQKVFPKVQFIATTHSPMIIASAKNVWCINIEDLTHPVAAKNGYGLEIKYILKNIQNADDMPAKVSELIRSFYQAIDKLDLAKARMVLQNLQAEIGENSPVAVKARERLELEQALLEMDE